MSADYAERVVRWERMDRTAKMATTYLRKASLFLHPRLERLPVSYWYVLEAAFDTALDIVNALPDDYFETTEIGDVLGLGAALGVDMTGVKSSSSDEPLEKAQKVVAAIERRRGDAKRRRLIAALENVEGRSPEEARAYLDKAAELRQHGDRDA